MALDQAISNGSGQSGSFYDGRGLLWYRKGASVVGCTFWNYRLLLKQSLHRIGLSVRGWKGT